MNNKLIKRIFSGISTMCLMVGLFLFFSCGTDDESSGGGVTKPYLSLKQYGLNRVSVADVGEAVFSFTVKRHG